MRFLYTFELFRMGNIYSHAKKKVARYSFFGRNSMERTIFLMKMPAIRTQRYFWRGSTISILQEGTLKILKDFEKDPAPFLSVSGIRWNSLIF